MKFFFDQKFCIQILNTKIIDNCPVFGWFDATGAVNKKPTGAHTCCGVFEDAVLESGLGAELFRVVTPFCIGVAAKHTGIGAGDVGEDDVKAAHPIGWGWGSKVMFGRLDVTEGKGGEVGREFDLAGPGDVVCDDLEGGSRIGSDGDGFPAGGGAGIEDRGGLFGNRELGRVPLSGVLNDGETLAIPVADHGGQFGWADEVGGVLGWRERGRRFCPGVEPAEIGWWHPLVPFEEGIEIGGFEKGFPVADPFEGV